MNESLRPPHKGDSISTYLVGLSSDYVMRVTELKEDATIVAASLWHGYNTCGGFYRLKPNWKYVAIAGQKKPSALVLRSAAKQLSTLLNDSSIIEFDAT